jgi:hypothetical protein
MGVTIVNDVKDWRPLRDTKSLDRSPPPAKIWVVLDISQTYYGTLDDNSNVHSQIKHRAKTLSTHSPNRLTFDLAVRSSASISLICASKRLTRSASSRAACRYGAIRASTALAILSNSSAKSFCIASSTSADTFLDEFRTFFFTSARFWGSCRIPAYLKDKRNHGVRERHADAKPCKKGAMISPTDNSATIGARERQAVYHKRRTLFRSVAIIRCKTALN